MPTPAVLFQDAELAALFERRRDHHTGGIVARAAGVIAEPHRAVAEGAFRLRIGVIVRPQGAVGVAAFQVGQGKDALRAVDEFAHVELVEALFVVLQAQPVDVEQVAAAGDGVFQGDDLAPLAIRAQRPGVDLGFAGPVLGQFLAPLAVAEFLARPERVSLVGDRAGRGKVGFPPLCMRGHGTGQAVQFGKVADPEIFVDVDVAMVALGGGAVGGEEPQFGPGLAVFAQGDGVALEFDPEPLGGEGDDVAAENLGLGPAGGQEHLVIAGQHGVHEGFGGEVVGEANLAAFQDVADPLGERVPLGGEQLLLIAEHLAGELLQEVRFGQLADVVLQLLLAPLAATLATVAAPALAALAVAHFCRHFGQHRRRPGGLLLQALAQRGEPVQLVQLGLGQGAGLLQQQGDAPADGGQGFLVRQHLVPAALGDPVVDDPDIGQAELGLNLTRFAAA